MAFPQRFSLRTFLLVIAVMAFLLAAAPQIAALFSRYAVGVHQRAVASEMDGWSSEYAVILNEADAIHSAEMLAYIAGHYLPSEEYRSFASNEDILLQSRRRAIDRIVYALQTYTGLELGSDIQAWSEWAKAKRTYSSHAG